MEGDLKSGHLPAVVATSSLELGIDMGAVDLVVQVEAPPSVASGAQRVGRAGHQVGAVSQGVFFPKFRGDLVASRVIVEGMGEGARAPHPPSSTRGRPPPIFHPAAVEPLRPAWLSWMKARAPPAWMT